MTKVDYLHQKFIEWRQEIKRHWFLILISLILIIVALGISYFAGFYVTNTAEVNSVSDLILDHFGPYDFRFFFVWAFLIFLYTGFFYPLFFNVKKVHVTIFQFSFFIILRSFFIILTHLRTPIDAVSKGNFPGILNLLNFSNDQFFSGHVSIPFLFFLIFKESKIRYFFLAGSIFMSVIVLAMHQHYSIDVFAAFFITYGCYKTSEWFIKKLRL